jgi:hypothetical protein
MQAMPFYALHQLIVSHLIALYRTPRGHPFQCYLTPALSVSVSAAQWAAGAAPSPSSTALPATDVPTPAAFAHKRVLVGAAHNGCVDNVDNMNNIAAAAGAILSDMYTTPLLHHQGEDSFHTLDGAAGFTSRSSRILGGESCCTNDCPAHVEHGYAHRGCMMGRACSVYGMTDVVFEFARAMATMWPQLFPAVVPTWGTCPRPQWGEFTELVCTAITIPLHGSPACDPTFPPRTPTELQVRQRFNHAVRRCQMNWFAEPRARRGTLRRGKDTQVQPPSLHGGQCPRDADIFSSDFDMFREAPVLFPASHVHTRTDYAANHAPGDADGGTWHGYAGAVTKWARFSHASGMEDFINAMLHASWLASGRRVLVHGTDTLSFHLSLRSCDVQDFVRHTGFMLPCAKK